MSEIICHLDHVANTIYTFFASAMNNIDLRIRNTGIVFSDKHGDVKLSK